MRRGSWSKEEDEILINYVKLHGHGKWRRIANNAGLKRSGKSCRLRWLNYLSPDIKRGDITVDEEDLIIRLHRLLGNRWSLIAGRLPGRTDNEIKNYWNTTLKKKSNMLNFSSRFNNKAKITKLSGEDTQKALASDSHDLVNNNNGDRLVSNLDSSLPVGDGMIFLPNENDAVFIADIGDIESGCFASDFNVASSLAQGCTSLEDDAKLLDDVEFDKALNKLASFLDLDED